MKKLFAFLLCVVLLFSFLVSCSSDDSPVSDSLDNSPASDDGGTAHEYKSWSFKRFIPAKEGDPDTFYCEEVNALRNGGGIRAPYYAPYEFNRLRASSRDEMVKLLSGLPYGAVYGFYATALYRLHQEGFYIEPQYDGKSVFAWNEQLYLSPRTSIEIKSSQMNKWGEWGYECQIDMGDEKNLYVAIRYLPKRYVAYAREYPFMYICGFPAPGKASDEQLIQQCADSCIELMVDGKKTKAYLRADSDYLQRLYFVCDAGYLVTLESRYGAQLDLVFLPSTINSIQESAHC